MISRLLKFFSHWSFRLFQVVPIENTYFLPVKIAKKVKLSPAMVHLNYLSRSPFSNASIIYVRRKEDLYLWFSRQDNPSSQIMIPEAYLLYLTQADDLKEGIIVFRKPACTAYLVVKSATLMAQVVVEQERCTEEHHTDLISLLSREHSLSDPPVVSIDSSAELRPNWRAVQHCLHWDINPSQLLRRSFELVQGPLIVYLTILMTYQLFVIQWIDGEHSRLHKQLVELKDSNRPIKNRYGTLQKEIDFWTRFAKNEIYHPNLQQVLEVVAAAVVDDSGAIIRFNYSGHNATARIQTKSGASKLVRNLLASGYFKEVKVVTSRQDRADKSLQVVDIAMSLLNSPVLEKKEESS